jgi:hypothetical protein
MKKAVFLSMFIVFMLLASVSYAKENDVSINTADKKDIEKIYEKIRSSDIKIEFFGTEYNTNENATVWLQLLRNYQPIDNSSCYITAYYPNKTIFLNNTLMFYLINSDGLYYYDLITPDVTGVYMLSARCNIPSDAFSDDFLDYSKLESYENVSIQNDKILLKSGIASPSFCSESVTDLWHFDENSGVYTYDSCGNLTMTITDASWVTGKFNYALFYETADYSITNERTYNPIPTNTSNFTISAWFNCSAGTTTYLPVVAKTYGSETSIVITLDKTCTRLYIFRNGGSQYYSPTPTITVNTWHNVVVVHYSDDTLLVYLDGNLIGSTGSFNIIPKNHYVQIGKWSTYYFNGTIDELAFFNKSLNSYEVLGIWNTTYTLNGYIKSIPLTLNGSSWLNYSSNYNLKDGNIDFKILDNSNNVLCSSLGDISSCANTNSPIKLYAQLTRPNNTSVSPEIDSWFVKWNIPALEEIRGSGELHVSLGGICSLSDTTLNDIALRVIQYMLALKDKLFGGLI